MDMVRDAGRSGERRKLQASGSESQATPPKRSRTTILDLPAEKSDDKSTADESSDKGRGPSEEKSEEKVPADDQKSEAGTSIARKSKKKRPPRFPSHMQLIYWNPGSGSDESESEDESRSWSDFSCLQEGYVDVWDILGSS